MEGIKRFFLLMWFKKIRLETPFKGNNVKAFVKTSNCENLVIYFSEKFQKIATFAMLFWFSVTKQSFEMVSARPNDQKCPRHPLVLKLNVTLARSLCLKILYFFLNGKSCQMNGTCIFMTAKETRNMMCMGSPIQNNC